MEFRYFRGKDLPRFANESERELAALLDAAGLPWQYEPRTFPLERDEQGRLLEAVTPDFYLPDGDLYIECTEMKPSLANRKRRKLRKLGTRYGEVVTLVGRSDFERLREKYGQSTESKKAQGRGSAGNGDRPTLATTKRPSASGTPSSSPTRGGAPSRSTNT